MSSAPTEYHDPIGWWILVVAGIILGWSLNRLRTKDVKEKRSGKKTIGAAGAIPRGSSGWPLIGETLDFIASAYTTRPVSFMEKRVSLYGKVFKTHILGRRLIVSTDPEVNKVVLQNQGNIFIPHYPKSIAELLGKSSILQMNGTLHRRFHALVGGFLRSPQLKARITPYIEHSVKLTLSTWPRMKTDKHQRPPVLLYLQEETKKITFEVLVRVLMSVGPGQELDFLRREYGEFIKGLICLPIKFPGTQLYKSLKAKERLMEMVRRIVEERRVTSLDDDKTTLEENGGGISLSANDAVDVLLRDITAGGGGGGGGGGDPSNDQMIMNIQHQLPLDCITGNIIEMMIPGEDSVPMVMTLAVKFLSDNPLALSRLVEENMGLKRHKAHTCDDYTWTDYMSLPFTQNVISETLRMGNIINAVWRKALKDVEIKGYLIPKGWCVLASFSSVHMDEENHEDPYQFDPWRWEKTGAAVNNNTFTPFGGGQRLCPGLELSRLEISIFLHHLVTTYRWVAEKDDIINFPTVKMKRKLPITIIPIDQ